MRPLLRPEGPVLRLELLTDDEVELTSTISIVIVESVSPVNSEKPDHREEDPHTDTGRPSDLERIEVPYV